MYTNNKKGRLEFFENIFELTGTGIAQVSATGKFLMINKHFCDIIGYSRDEILNMKFEDITYSKDIKKNLENVEKIFSGEINGYSMEKRYIKKDGSIIWVILDVTAVRDSFSNLKYYVSVVNDITKKKKDELELKKQSLALKRSPVCIIVTDINAIIQYANPALYNVSGYTVEEVIGKTPSILNAGILPKEFYANLWKTIKSGKVWTGTFVNKKKNGEIYYEESSISPIFNSLNQIDSFVAVKEDITERKKIQEDLVKSRLEAEKANKAKSVFIANMSHEIRTPLNAILGFSKQLYRGTNLTKEQKNTIDIINRSGEHLLNIINSILEISKIEAGKVSIHTNEFQILTMLKDIYKMFSLQIEKKGVELDINISSSMPLTIITDEVKLRQIIINLIGNALKFTDKGQILIDVDFYENFDKDKEVEKENGEKILICSIKDTGPGMTEAEIERIFNYFEQGSSQGSKGGTGLGLSITKNFIELLGGHIKVESESGKGSKFSFYIPIKTEEIANEKYHDEIYLFNKKFKSLPKDIIKDTLRYKSEDVPEEVLLEEVSTNILEDLSENSSRKAFINISKNTLETTLENTANTLDNISIPKEYKDEIKKAILDGDIENIHRSIKAVEQQYSEIAAVLFAFVEDFEYEKALELIEVEE